MKAYALIILLVLIFPLQVIAAKSPSAHKTDYRMRNTTYDENQVYYLRTSVGYATFIKLEKGENLAKWYSGDPEAWLIEDFENIISVKPKVESSKSNLVLISDKGRIYTFFIAIKKDGFYGIRFDYPESEAQKLAALKEKKEISEALENSLKPELQTRSNVKYIAAGDEEIRPFEAWDNGTHTYFYFKEGADLPAIYRKTGNGEKLTQRTTIDNWLIIPHVEDAWVLRLGDLVVCVKNLSETDLPINETSTSSPTIKLKIKNPIEGGGL